MQNVKRITTTISTLFLALTLAGCAALGAAATVGNILTNPTPIDQQAGSLVDERAYGGLLSGERVLNELAINAVDIGFLTPGSSTAITVDEFLDKYAQVSKAAQKAKALNDAEGVKARVAEGKALYKEIMTLIRGG